MNWREAPATVAITAATVVASLAILASGALPTASLGAGAIAARFAGANLPADLAVQVPAWLTPLSCSLVHASIAHLALNLVMLVYCGAQAERTLGSGALLVLYGVGAYAAALGQWLLAPLSVVPMIGASGAISAVVATYALLFGQRRATAIGPIPGGVVHVAWLAAAWIGIQALVGFAGMGVPGAGGAGIAVGAHVGGFLAGLALARPLLLWHYRHA
ncbi:rhomboid family intramembrane serine protease [Sphingomonas bacterium]|uniref:rhomboid family intramembrane serine protease n=1 Tax=Sphingomonas bacterium TaxID=1895847 RepID=UPI0015777C05|nr:rhomboid family intramembrane serine protease [Sphingomonas bacterium]